MAGGLRRLTLSGAVAVCAMSLALSSCATSNGLSLAKQACAHVARSVSVYESSEHESDSATAEKERTEALEQLRAALPLAATAAGEAPQWQALMATLSESTRIPESNLVHALEAQCAVASAGGNQFPGSAS